jgi:calcium-dependent protein kinase
MLFDNDPTNNFGSPDKSSYYDLQQENFHGRICFEDISNVYKMGKEIGSGRYGIVRLVAKKSYESKRFAVKSISRERINTDIQLLQRELDILMAVDHPNIINFHEIYMD